MGLGPLALVIQDVVEQFTEQIWAEKQSNYFFNNDEGTGTQC